MPSPLSAFEKDLAAEVEKLVYERLRELLKVAPEPKPANRRNGKDDERKICVAIRMLTMIANLRDRDDRPVRWRGRMAVTAAEQALEEMGMKKKDGRWG